MPLNFFRMINASFFFLSFFLSFLFFFFFFSSRAKTRKKFSSDALVPPTLMVSQDRIEKQKNHLRAPTSSSFLSVSRFLSFFSLSASFFSFLPPFFPPSRRSFLSRSSHHVIESFECVLMWFVNIDHWTIKLVYLVCEKLTGDHSQVDIDIDQNERNKQNVKLKFN